MRIATVRGKELRVRDVSFAPADVGGIFGAGHVYDEVYLRVIRVCCCELPNGFQDSDTKLDLSI
jgi:hypothetical protein